MKPKIFIGSSREGLAIANAIHSNLTSETECTVWKDGVFQPSSSTLIDLMRILRTSDFAIFVFSPDDVSMMRDNTDKVVRDNVLFELGLFIGRLGPERCFFLVPDLEKMRLPTDLFGVNPTKYESGRSDSNWEAAVDPACMQILRLINQLKSFQDSVEEVEPEHVPIAKASAVARSRKAPKPSQTADAAKLTLEPYKRSFLLKGNSDPHRARLLGLGYLSFNGTLQAWVIPWSREEEARADLADLL